MSGARTIHIPAVRRRCDNEWALTSLTDMAEPLARLGPRSRQYKGDLVGVPGMRQAQTDICTAPGKPPIRTTVNLTPPSAGRWPAANGVGPRQELVSRLELGRTMGHQGGKVACCRG